MKRALLLSLTLVACGGPSSEPGSPWNPLRREVPEFAEGINAYKDSRWVDAEKKFDSINGQTPSSAGHFDVGSAQYKQQKFQEAGENFNRVLSSMSEDEKERAYFNLGNTEASGGNLEKAKEYYRRALELRPNDMDARYNLEWAQRMLEKPKDQNDKGKPDEKKDEEKKDDQKQEDKKNDEQQAENDKKEGDKQKEGADKKKDEEKKEGEEKSAQNDKKEGEEKKERAGEQEKPGEDKKEAAGADGKGEEQKSQEAKLAEGEPQPGGKEQKLDKQETAAILDSLLAGEKNLQMWKFQQNGKRPPPRSESAKPW